MIRRPPRCTRTDTLLPYTPRFRSDLVENLGTIAGAGTGAFLEQLSGDARKDVALIGQFGVGFYAAFMVADTVEVTSCKAGETQSWTWRSDGKGSVRSVEHTYELQDLMRTSYAVFCLKKKKENYSIDENDINGLYIPI